MKRLLPSVFLFLSALIPVSQLPARTGDFSYSNDYYGVQVLPADDWMIGSDRETVPDSLKSIMPEAKDPDVSPLFLGQLKNGVFFVRFLTEESDISIEDYFRLFEHVIHKEKMVMESAEFSEKNNAMVWVYSGRKNGAHIRFRDYLTWSDGAFLRISFWSLSSLSGKYRSAADDLAAKVRVSDNYGKQSFPFRELDSDLKKLTLNPEIKAEANVPDAAGKPGAPFYTIQGKRNRVFILGSVHVGKPEFYPFPDYIEKSFAESENLAVEADIRKVQDPEIAEKIRSVSLLEENQTLDKVISQSLYTKIDSILKDYGLSIEKFQRFRPWIIAVTLSRLSAASEGYLSEEGADRYFLNASAGKKVIELEGALEQIRFLSELDNEPYLAYNVMMHKTAGYRLNKMMKAWRSGDAEGVLAQAFPDPELLSGDEKNIHKKLITDRNIIMAKKIEGFLDQEEDYFIVIGAAHIGGKGGVIELLRSEGFNPVHYKGEPPGES